MINVPITQIDKCLIDSLIANCVRESRSLEFKEKLPSSNRDESKEFLADVSAFANASGGHIIYGIAEERGDRGATGIPSSVTGVGDVNLDSEIRRLESMIRDGIEPRIIGTQFRPIGGFDGGPVIVLHIPKSYLAPHMLSRGDSRFYSRNSAGKYPLDVSEIRSVFAQSEELPEKIRRFREDRIGRIVAEEPNSEARPCPMTVLHILPFSALNPGTRVDVSRLVPYRNDYPPFSLAGFHRQDYRYNIDGLLLSGRPWNQGFPSSTLQVFRSGAIEVIDSTLLGVEPTPFEVPQFSAPVFERKLLESLRLYLRLLTTIQVEPPLVVMLSLLGAKRYRVYLAGPNNQWELSRYGIDRDVLLLPEALMQNSNDTADGLLQPAFDAIWNCVGYERDLLYRDGIWHEK